MLSQQGLGMGPGLSLPSNLMIPGSNLLECMRARMAHKMQLWVCLRMWCCKRGCLYFAAMHAGAHATHVRPHLTAVACGRRRTTTVAFKAGIQRHGAAAVKG